MRINVLFKNKELCKKMGKTAFEKANERYAPEKHYVKLMAMFNQAIAKKKKNGDF